MHFLLINICKCPNPNPQLKLPLESGHNHPVSPLALQNDRTCRQFSLQRLHVRAAGRGSKTDLRETLIRFHLLLNFPVGPRPPQLSFIEQGPAERVGRPVFPGCLILAPLLLSLSALILPPSASFRFSQSEGKRSRFQTQQALLL